MNKYGRFVTETEYRTEAFIVYVTTKNKKYMKSEELKNIGIAEEGNQINIQDDTQDKT